jgi:nitrogen fixation protein FixH
MIGSPAGTARVWRHLSSQDRWIPWAFVGFFVVLVAVDGIMVRLALDSWPGVESDNAYEEGLAYNKTLDEARRQQAMGWRYGFAFRQTSEKRGGHLEVTLRDRNGLALAHTAVTARLIRPTSDGHDFEVAFADDGNGLYTAEVDIPLLGVWEVRVAAAGASGTYRRVERIFVR